ncbi:ABC transporter permease [Pseudonocardia sp. KRD-184]|uniref:ABC transporter permease n=2 Tax=Pseudonocardia oceani TaxID=2792013 RepID=A0ABS6UF54_9PSEU|nr:ABC transporter permease [Pseudonocardia oceani]MBW0089166.1 ABC transporter permease [Pseudonocardia oceani]MBW0096111.1 ABC transporter permease [Pseudonocardia oceani]MBW0120955.1 ABC transporter permease [Pseudonocardia oceani]MBW0130862.1 ABC transporter permease [Pseudonocardia oceani]
MLKFFALRVLTTVPVLVLVTFVVFGLVLLIPGDPAVTIAGPDATVEQVAAVRERLGLDRPTIVQYWDWVTGALSGDLGTSLFTSRPVATSIADGLPVTIALASTALLISLAIAVPVAILSALRRGTWIDRVATAGSSLGIALPSFWLGLVFVLVFSLALGWLPATGYVPISEDPGLWLAHILLPALTLGIAGAAESTRQLRGSIIGVLQQDYVRTARAKGLRSRMVIGKHVLKNASVPLVTVLGLQITALLGGAVLVEQVFGVPGLGQVAINAVTTRDVPVIQGIVLVAVLVAVVSNLLVDLAYGYLNPKVRPR